MLAARSGTYKLFGGDWLSTINESSTELSLLYLMYCTLHVTSGSKFLLLPKYSDSGKCIARWWLAGCFCSVDAIPRILRHLRLLHRGGMPRRKSRAACALRSLYQHYSICFLTSRSLGSSQSSQPHSSPPRLKICYRDDVSLARLHQL